MGTSTFKYQKALPSLNLKGEIKQTSEDFVVEEIISFEPTGEGEHLFLWIQKRNQNTDWVAKQIARWAGVNNRLVNFGGLKDRYAVTRQWFSVHLPGKADPDFDLFDIEGTQVLKSTRHNKALKSSALRGNRFNITISQLSIEDRTTLNEQDIQNIEERIQWIKIHGAPNYFGEQRFGIDGGNLEAAKRLFANESRDNPMTQRMAVSAARSHIFNLVLEKRIQNQSWNQYLAGDVCMLNGSKSFFDPNEQDKATLPARMNELDIHPTGIMMGKGALHIHDEVEKIEQEVIEQQSVFAQGLISKKLPMERRALRVRLHEFSFQVLPDQIHLSFMLPAGSFATAVVREIIDD
ncbi:tRNA pseudouridine(13) synthase TruD [Marinicellulosiphila megalodicopiae]|uniref:tRNA pseudouridine(13) synthase TruD n=1 Tax=Marinicellulosiphila megalodicopiae TaxID=2724896 RepID=UPI003BB03E9A